LYVNFNSLKMKTRLLFPHSFKRIGWFLLIPSAVLGFFVVFFDLQLDFLDMQVFAVYTGGFNLSGNSSHFLRCVSNNITDEIAGVLFLLGAIFVAFSKEKNEDEFIARIRLDSLLWATYINYAILILCFLFVFDFGFLKVMIFNMFTILILFIVRYYFTLYRAQKSLSYEK